MSKLADVLELLKAKKEVKPLSREDYARRGAELKKARIQAELAANEKIAMVYSWDFLKELGKDLERESRRFELPETIVLRNISNAELHDYVNSLPGQFARIINLHYFEGFSYEEIAKELKCPPSTVRVSAKRALGMLKDVLQGKRDVKGGKIGRPKTLSIGLKEAG